LLRNVHKPDAQGSGHGPCQLIEGKHRNSSTERP
jgi:hypothetical protein